MGQGSRRSELAAGRHPGSRARGEVGDIAELRAMPRRTPHRVARYGPLPDGWFVAESRPCRSDPDVPWRGSGCTRSQADCPPEAEFIPMSDGSCNKNAPWCSAGPGVTAVRPPASECARGCRRVSGGLRRFPVRPGPRASSPRSACPGRTGKRRRIPS